MYTLEDITTYDLIYLDIVSIKVKELLLNYKITNFKTLEEFVLIGHYEFVLDEIIILLNKAYKLLESVNKKELLITAYTPSIEDSTKKKLIFQTDQELLAIELPYILTSPGGSSLRWGLEEITIATYKELISKITLDGKNALTKILYGFGPKRWPELIVKIDFYNAQLKRVLSAVPNDFKDNLFLFQQEEKRRVIENNFEDIFERLFSLSNRFIFGSLKQSLAKKIIKDYPYFRDLEGYTKKDDFVYRFMTLPLINFVANYTTLEELQEGATDKTLQRFVK